MHDPYPAFVYRNREDINPAQFLQLVQEGWRPFPAWDRPPGPAGTPDVGSHARVFHLSAYLRRLGRDSRGRGQEIRSSAGGTT